jgi:hypothetical protein
MDPTALGRRKPSNVNWGNQLTDDDDLVVEVRKAIAMSELLDM